MCFYWGLPCIVTAWITLCVLICVALVYLAVVGIALHAVWGATDVCVGLPVYVTVGLLVYKCWATVYVSVGLLVY